MNAPIDPHASPRLECDLIMKGGITSGVIYPQAVAELARTYRLRSVGGTSAGAIAAAAAAAAEFGRDSGGFAELDRLPHDLTVSGPDGRTRLATFFQPTRTAAPLFRLLAVGERRTGAARYAALARALLRGYWWQALAGALPGGLLVVLSALGSGIAQLAGVVGGVVVLVLGLALAVALGVARTAGQVAQDGFGACTGMPGVDSGDAPALTPWLHAKLQSLAGLSVTDDPLTFGDLERSRITLRMMTSNLTRHQPMAMPWQGREYYFDPEQLRRLFPAEIVNWMEQKPPELPTEPAAAFRSQLLRAQAGRLRPWPAPADLPVLVATRMSLSFPALITAVPLHAVDYTQPANQLARSQVAPWRRAHPEGTVERALDDLAAPEFSAVWFSDGGLCANLPVHFFDSPLPTRPSFAFDLGPFPPGRDKSRDQAENSYLPTDNRSGHLQPWFSLPTRGLGAWGGFVMALVDTARTWVDAAQLTMHGYKDRVVTVHHDHSEGGLNLSMPQQVVSELSERGRLGAVKLLEVFAGDQPGVVVTPGWDNHRWVRFRTATAGLTGWLEQFGDAYAHPSPGSTAYRDLAGPGAAAELPSYRPGVRDRRLLNQRASDLVRMAQEWTGDTAMTNATPSPRPRMRLVPDDGTAAGLEDAGLEGAEVTPPADP